MIVAAVPIAFSVAAVQTVQTRLPSPGFRKNYYFVASSLSMSCCYSRNDFAAEGYNAVGSQGDHWGCG